MIFISELLKWPNRLILFNVNNRNMVYEVKGYDKLELSKILNVFLHTEWKFEEAERLYNVKF